MQDTNNLGSFGKRNLPTEVWSEVPLRVTSPTNDVTEIPARTLTTLTAEQWSSHSIRRVPGDTSRGEINFRNLSAGGRRYPWEKFTIIPDESLSEFADFSIFSYPLQGFYFSETLPDYLSDDDRFNTSFEALDEAKESLVTTAINRWRDIIAGPFPAVTAGAERQMQIFMADLGDSTDLMSFAPADGLGHDLVLNTRSSLFDSENPEAMFRLLNAIGKSIGLPDVDSVDRFTSVMGTAPVTGPNESLFPTYPMKADQALSGYRSYSFNTTDVIEFPTTGGFMAAAARSPMEYIAISGESQSLPVSIDLRGGESSSVLGSPELRRIFNGPRTKVTEGIGGSGNDGIRGNDEDNRLVGNAGNDVLNGGSGDDLLQGGTGNDYYIFGIANGKDLVDETAGGGVDVIRFEGMHDHDSIPEDFTFRRFGNDLIVRLELNNERDNSGDVIRIRDMGTESSRVEALALFNPDGFVNRISLVSVWEQSTEARQRFQIVRGNDGFGTLVSPV